MAGLPSLDLLVTVCMGDHTLLILENLKVLIIFQGYDFGLKDKQSHPPRPLRKVKACLTLTRQLMPLFLSFYD